MKSLLQTAALSPTFALKKLLRAPRDTDLPGGYHATLRSWSALRTAPFLHISPRVDMALFHIVGSIPEGSTIEFNLFDVEYPWELVSDDNTMVWENTWNAYARERTEDAITRGEVQSVQYLHKPDDPQSLCVIVPKVAVRRVYTNRVRATKFKEIPQEPLIPGAEDFTKSFDGYFEDHFIFENLPA